MKDPVKQVFNFLSRYNKPVSSHSLGLFRIVFCVYLFFIIAEVFHFRALVFEQVPGTGRSVFPSTLFLFIWTVSCLFLLVGLYTRYAAILTYICVIIATSIFMGTNMGSFNDDLLRLGSLFSIFLPVSRSFSLDALRERLTYASPAPRQTSYLNYLLMLFITLGLLYFPSGITKLCSETWLQGLGLWKPCTMPYRKWNTLPNLFLNHQWFMYGLNYFIIVWEIVFVFLLFIPRTHKFLAVSGIIFHVGIALFFTFPLICVGPIIFYTLFIPSSSWSWLKEKLRSGNPISVFVNQHNPTTVRYWRVLQSLDFRNRFLQVHDPAYTITLDSFQKFITLLKTYTLYIPLALILQFDSLKRLLQLANRQWINPTFKEYYTFSTYRFRQMVFIYCCIFYVLAQTWILSGHCYRQLFLGPETNYTPRTEYDLKINPSRFLRIFIGMNSRGLFLDNSSSGKKFVYALAYFDKNGKEQWLPLFDEKGYVKGDMNMNMAWSKITFHLLSWGSTPVDSIGLKKLTWFWADTYKFNLDSLHLIVYKKTYTYPLTFEKDCYLKQEALPWEKAGEIWWRNQVFSYYPEKKDISH